MAIKDFANPSKGGTRNRVDKLKRTVESTGVLTFFRSFFFLISAGFILFSLGNLVYSGYHSIPGDRMHITGNHIVPSDIILKLADIENTPINSIDVYDLKVAVEKYIWIKEADFKILYPVGIEARIVERKPVAFYRVRDHIYMLDDELMVLPPAYNRSGWDLPVIEDRTVTGTVRPGEIIRYPSLLSAIQLVNIFKIGNHITTDMVSEIDISDMFDIKVSTYGKNFLIHFGYDNFENKINNLYYAVPEIAKMKKPRVIDLRYKNKVIVK